MKCLRCSNFLGLNNTFCYRMMHKPIENCDKYVEVDADEYFRRCVEYALILLKRAEQYSLTAEPSRRDIQYLMHITEAAKRIIRDLAVRIAKKEASERLGT